MFNLKGRLVLRNGEKSLRDNVPIRFNEWSTAESKSRADQNKTSLVKFSVLTHNHGVGSKGNARDCSVGTKSSLKLDRLEDNPRAVIEVWQSIFNELLPAMIDVDPITAVELFEAHLTGSAAREFQQIAYKVSDHLFEHHIDVDLNMRICKFKQTERDNAQFTEQQILQLPKELKFKAAELKKWLDKNELRKSARAGMVGVKEYKYTFPPPTFPRPPARPSKGKFLKWNVTGINALNANAWLRQHNHGWEFGEKYLEMVFKEVQLLTFKTFGAHAGRTQLDYLTEDLCMDPTHSLKQFFRLLTAHSEAQPYYPQISSDSEVGAPFHDERKIQIVWNAGFELFKDELTMLGVSRRDDLKGHFEICTNKFILAEQHRNAKEQKTSTPGKPIPRVDKVNKGKQVGGPGNNQGGDKDRFYGACTFCGTKGHRANDCFKNPKSSSYRQPKNPRTEQQSKKRRISQGAKRLPYDEWKRKKEYEQYCLENVEDEDLSYSEE
jgi:hypothetical protein